MENERKATLADESPHRVYSFHPDGLKHASVTLAGVGYVKDVTETFDELRAELERVTAERDAFRRDRDSWMRMHENRCDEAEEIEDTIEAWRPIVEAAKDETCRERTVVEQNGVIWYAKLKEASERRRTAVDALLAKESNSENH